MDRQVSWSVRGGGGGGSGRYDEVQEIDGFMVEQQLKCSSIFYEISGIFYILSYNLINYVCKDNRPNRIMNTYFKCFSKGIYLIPKLLETIHLSVTYRSFL